MGGISDYQENYWKMIRLAFYDLPNAKENEMIDYCHEYNLSLKEFSFLDISDASGMYDTVSTFIFTDNDAIFFKLKFS